MASILEFATSSKPDNVYGTSVDGIRDFVLAGYQPIISPHYQALKMLRTPELKPYIINIKAPPFERLKETRHRAYARSTFDETSSRSFTDDEFDTMIKAGEKIERLYAHWFDMVIENEDLNSAFEQLVKAVRRLDQDAQWVPVSWVQ
jgi:guanylate kinase